MTHTDAEPRPTSAAALPTVSVVGAGAMGFPMAVRLHDRGFPLRVVDLDPARVEAARGIGLAADTELASIAGSDVVLVMVATGAQLAELLAAPVVTGGGLAGAVLVVLSTVGPEALHAARGPAERAGVRLLDSPVTGGVAGAVAGTLTLFTAGDPAAVAAAAAALGAVGVVRVVGPNLGDGQAFKLVNQMLTTIHLAAAGEAIAFAERLGLDLAVVAELLPTGAGNSWMFADRAPRMVRPAAERRTETRLAVFVKDSGLVAEAAASAGAHAPLTAATHGVWQRATELGLDAGDDSGVVEVFRRG
ncbi:NAD(P)-dependent oxidoreductase [Nocardia sp. NPDC057353]|uniref:NAD(P)-dependent oxidoreductase n=1 Tax=Nocardia sp. NPDC057353 TaxID=3346104 RepID=UPI00363641F0